VRLVCGVGKNDATWQVSQWVDGRKVFHPIYDIWKNMIRRCYSDRPEFSAYSDCSVCADWLSLTTFWEWAEQQDYQGMHLDKDLLVSGNRIYGPETCLFIPSHVNRILSETRRELPMGVYLTGSRRYKAQIGYGGNLKYLGTFDDPYLASCVYRKAREEEIRRFAHTLSDTVLASKLLERISNDHQADRHL
jgi:hypothetical protein